MSSQPAVAPSGTAQQLRGSVRVLARTVWITLALLAVAVFVGGEIVYWPELAQVCTLDPQSCSTAGLLTPDGARQLQALGLPVSFYALYDTLLNVIFAGVWWAVALVIFWRRSDDRMALLVSLFLMIYGPITFGPGGVVALADKHWVFWLIVKSVQFSGLVCFTLFFCLFPNGRFVPGWTRSLALAFLVWTVPSTFFPADSPLNLANRLSVPGLILITPFLLGFMVAQIRRYRYVSSVEERQQTKWVVFGMVVALSGLVVTGVLATTLPLAAFNILAFFVVFAGVYGVMLLIPLSIGVAMLRSRLFDIDVIINRTLVYGTLSALLALIYAAGIVLVGVLLRPFADASSDLSVVVSTLGTVMVFQPLRRRVQAAIDRRFYRRRYSARRTVEAFGTKLRAETDLHTLTKDLVDVVQETLQPAHVSLWLCEGQRRGETAG